MAGALLLVGAMLSAFVWLDVGPIHRVTHELRMVDLSVTPPPPPPPARTPAKPKLELKASPPPIVAPPPIVPIQAPPPPVATVPQAAPPQAVVVTPPAPPAPAPRPAAPANAGDLSSTMISATPPTYPVESRRTHEQGTVILLVTLGTDGRVADLSVQQSSGSDRLDHAALSAVRHWRWKPQMQDGQAVMVRGLVKIPFILKA